jgi:hypothetical protein
MVALDQDSFGSPKGQGQHAKNDLCPNFGTGLDLRFYPPGNPCLRPATRQRPHCVCQYRYV